MKLLCSVLAFSLLTLLSQAFAASATGVALVERVDGMWSKNGFIIDLVGVLPASVNPDNCSTTDGFATDPTFDVNILQLHHSMILSAHMAGKEVDLVISGCAENRPRIIAVRIP